MLISSGTIHGSKSKKGKQLKIEMETTLEELWKNYSSILFKIRLWKLLTGVFSYWCISLDFFYESLKFLYSMIPENLVICSHLLL